MEGASLQALNHNRCRAIADLDRLHKLVHVNLYVPDHMSRVEVKLQRSPERLVLAQVEWEALVERVGQNPYGLDKWVVGAGPLEQCMDQDGIALEGVAGLVQVTR